MPTLEIQQKRSKLMPPIPHLIFINNQFVGQMQGDNVKIDIPSGEYNIRIQSLIRWFSSTQHVRIDSNVKNILTFGDREKVWDALFLVDIVGSIAKLFFTLPHPWEIIYEIFSWGYLILWLVYEWAIRKRYFRTEFAQYKSI